MLIILQKPIQKRRAATARVAATEHLNDEMAVRCSPSARRLAASIVAPHHRKGVLVRQLASQSILTRLKNRVHPTDEEILYGRKYPDQLLYCFGTEDRVKGWDIATDRLSGGKSWGEVTWHPWEKGPSGDLHTQLWPEDKENIAKMPPKGALQIQYDDEHQEEGKEGPPIEEGGFLRFSGETSLEKDPEAKRAGFCGTRPERREVPFDISEYGSISMRLRTDGRAYQFNIEPQSRVPDDLYQAVIAIPGGEWGTVTIPLHKLTLIGRGQYRVNQRELERAQLHSIGVSVADGKAAPFELDIAWISVIQEDFWQPEEEEDKLPRKIPPHPENGILEW